MFFCTCIQAFRAGVTLLMTLTTPHLHQLGVEGVQYVTIHCIYAVGQLQHNHTQDFSTFWIANETGTWAKRIQYAAVNESLKQTDTGSWMQTDVHPPGMGHCWGQSTPGSRWKTHRTACCASHWWSSGTSRCYYWSWCKHRILPLDNKGEFLSIQLHLDRMIPFTHKTIGVES